MRRKGLLNRSGIYVRFISWVSQNVEKRWWQHQSPCFGMRGLARVYHRLNQYNLKQRHYRQHTPAIPLISVGNITVGGSGKTPFVVWLSTELIQLGYKPVVICRGDGGGLRVVHVVKKEDKAMDVGDEAKMLAQQCGCPVIRGRDRVAAASMAETLGNVMILDDGFQYRQLKACVNLVLVPHVGVGNGCLLPAGPMREPLAALCRADVVVRTGGMHAPQVSDQKEWWAYCKPQALQNIQTLNSVKPTEVMALSSIARPQRFLDSLRQCELNVVKHAFFPDHHAFKKEDIKRIVDDPLAVVITAKDAVKLVDIWPKNKALWVLNQTVCCEQGLMEQIHGHMLRHKMENDDVG